jgi:hypothetical protein
MGKSLVLVAGLIGCLTVSARGAETAHAERGLCPADLPTQFRVLKEGKLIYLDPMRPRITIYPLPVRSAWDGYGLEAGDRFYGLDFGKDKEFRQRADRLLDKKVRVIGTVELRTLPGNGDRKIDVLVVTEIESAENVQKTIHVEAKGKLKCLHVTYDLITGTLNSVHDNWDAPQSRCEVKVPGLEVNGKLYGLTDVRPTSADDAKQFERLCGRTVIVTGIRKGDFVEIHALKADDEHVTKTVHVEMKGRFLFRADHLDILRPDSRLIVNDKTYVVDLGSDRDLWTAAAGLDGHTAIVTGTLDGDRITATAIKADNDQIKETVAVEIKGKLQYVITMRHTGEVLFTCDKLPKYLARCWSVRYGVTADGKLYLLDLGDNKELQKEAEKLVTTNVTVQGTLQGDEVRVKSLWSDFCGTTARTFGR